MADPRFFPEPSPVLASTLAEGFGLRLVGKDREVAGAAPLHLATGSDISFVANKARLEAVETVKAGVLVAPEALVASLEVFTLLVSSAPQRSFAAIARALYPDVPLANGISSAAHIDRTAVLADGVSVGPGAVIGAGAEIGANCQIDTGTVIGPGVVLGQDCRVGPNATVKYAILGDRVRVFSGAVIGEDGFGFVPGPAGLERIPQLGRVLIGNDVEIGANSCVDRGAGDDTVIGDGTKIDNLVQIAHNVRIGSHCILVSQAGVAGSTVLGDGVQLAGKAAISDHLSVGSGARIAGGSGVTKNVGPGETVAGYPAVPVRDWHRQTIALSKLAGRKKS